MCPRSNRDETHSAVATARREIEAWLRGYQERSGKKGMTTRTSVDWFIEIARNAGFRLSLNPTESQRGLEFIGEWTLNDHTFVGFKEPQSARDQEDARIFACAALIRNDWCRSRLP